MMWNLNILDISRVFHVRWIISMIGRKRHLEHTMTCVDQDHKDDSSYVILVLTMEMALVIELE